MFGVGKKFDKTMSIGYLMHTTILFLVYSIAYADAVDLSQPITRARFPPSFLFGTASSAYQYEGAIAEGGRKPSSMEKFFQTHPDIPVDHSNANVAVDQYHRYKEDVALMKDLGFNVYRLSIAWSRVLPNGNLIGGVNQEGINYYNNLINELLANGIQPAVTLFHWDLPQVLEDQYLGFLSPKIVDDFRDYADLCFKTFGDRVKYWITLNEPLMVSLAYTSGNSAPGRCSDRKICPAGNSTTEPYIVSHHQILAHAAAVKIYREKYQTTQKGEIGLSLSISWNIPFSDSAQDVAAASRSKAFQLGWFVNPLFNGSYPAVMVERVGDRLPAFTPEQANMVKGSYDFIGLNYYSSMYAADASCPNIISWFDDRCVKVTSDRNGIPIGPKAGDFINIYPEGLAQLLLYVKNTYNDPVIYITENGVIDLDTSSEAVILNDTFRIQYLQSHFNTLLEAMGQGVKVKGYMAWSLLDNFEWGKGYTYKFGIVYVDFVNGLKRTPKKSALWFKSILKPAK